MRGDATGAGAGTLGYARPPMRVPLLALATWLCLAPAVAARPDERSPIDFVVGNEVFTRREVLRNVGAMEATGTATPRERVYESVRLHLARESVLFQQAQHMGIAVAAEDVRARLRDEIRKSADPKSFYHGMRQLRADDVSQYLELLHRSMTVDEYRRRLLLGHEWNRAQPLQLLFGEVRPSDLVVAGRALRAERARPRDGWLWEARCKGPGAAACAEALARAWREAPGGRTLAADASKAAILKSLADAKVDTSGVAIDHFALRQADWAPGIYSQRAARPLYDVLQTLTPGGVSHPVAFDDSYWVFRLGRGVEVVPPSYASVEEDARGELIRVARNDRIREATAAALKTMYVWPQELAAALRKDAGLDSPSP